ncbi:helix-turn-helix domain-containing protein [Arthrobacter sp. JCM 19049]|uniref:helix-turn-helix domain-containing protein n=1 Tax=Arthrobacter sp. JCM 19049 TaxID=1460643 RepID=UPI000AB049C0|nr:helix-turn-helix domain-containing protein [Arthrobacter sp. JCM 19049]
MISFLALNQDIGQVASRMFVHQNTVRYRLRKAAELLGGTIAEARMMRVYT